MQRVKSTMQKFLTHLQPLALRRLSQNGVLRGAAQSGGAILHKGAGASQAKGGAREHL